MKRSNLIWVVLALILFFFACCNSVKAADKQPQKKHIHEYYDTIPTTIVWADTADIYRMDNKQLHTSLVFRTKGYKVARYNNQSKWMGEFICYLDEFKQPFKCEREVLFVK